MVLEVADDLDILVSTSVTEDDGWRRGVSDGDSLLKEAMKGLKFSEGLFGKSRSRSKSVSYTHLRAPRDLSTSRMPSSA